MKETGFQIKGEIILKIGECKRIKLKFLFKLTHNRTKSRYIQLKIKIFWSCHLFVKFKFLKSVSNWRGGTLLLQIMKIKMPYIPVLGEKSLWNFLEELKLTKVTFVWNFPDRQGRGGIKTWVLFSSFLRQILANSTRNFQNCRTGLNLEEVKPTF